MKAFIVLSFTLMSLNSFAASVGESKKPEDCGAINQKRAKAVEQTSASGPAQVPSTKTISK